MIRTVDKKLLTVRPYIATPLSLAGAIPNLIGNLTNLTQLWINNNSLSGKPLSETDSSRSFGPKARWIRVQVIN